MSETLNKTDKPAGVDAVKFILWLLIISIIMMFAAFTSAYIVRRSEGNWLDVILPDTMIINTLILVASSFFMQLAYFSAKKDNIGTLKMSLFITFALGIAFLAGQWQVWVELVQNNVYFGGPTANPAGSFLYVLTGVHGFHLITGLIFLIFVLISAFRFKVHSKNMRQIWMCTTYWHFLGALWVYLYLFLTVYK
ncbi:MAG TPA: cytochrome c oxidase subunit 3 [Adhaeribacter sp.]|nr:cytochrome c oxidase subunit 3 [Adhaeribacter sp.]